MAQDGSKVTMKTTTDQSLQLDHYNSTNQVLTNNPITTKLTKRNHDQRQKKYHHLTMKMTTAQMTTPQVVKTSVTNNSLSEDYPHSDDHTRQTTECSWGLP